METCEHCGREMINHYGLTTTCKHLQIARSALRELINMTEPRPKTKLSPSAVRRIARKAINATKGPSSVPMFHNDATKPTHNMMRADHRMNRTERAVHNG